jgi:hypothetical protein
VTRALGRNRDHDFRRRADLGAGGMVLTEPRFIVTETVEPGDQVQIVLQGQRRIDAGLVEWREKNAETQAGCHRHVLHRRFAAAFVEENAASR